MLQLRVNQKKPSGLCPILQVYIFSRMGNRRAARIASAPSRSAGINEKKPAAFCPVLQVYILSHMGNSRAVLALIICKSAVEQRNLLPPAAVPT